MTRRSNRSSVLGVGYLIDQDVSQLNAADLLHARRHEVSCSIASIQSSCHSCLQAVCNLQNAPNMVFVHLDNTHSPLAAQLASFSAHVKCTSRLINSVAACLKKPPCALGSNLRAGGHQVCNCSMITKVNQCTFGRLRPYLHIMAALSTMAIGFALSWPAISGAEPCTCIHNETIVECLCLSCQLRGAAEACVASACGAQVSACTCHAPNIGKLTGGQRCG